MTLAAADFVAFFRGIHGYEPFPWQLKLMERLAGDDDEWPADEWPDVLDLPTGSGKTAAMDVAIFHLALRFECPERAALRVALVVDRRLVVDHAYARAQKIVRCLDDPTQATDPGCTVLAEVSSRLRYLALASESNGDGKQIAAMGSPVLPLVAQRLRGGAPLESEWARTPTQPTVLCSTVDQVGSRLLFRGYGVSNRMRPVHAGLLGNNTLILLDEAHLSDPFRETVQAVRHLGNADVKTVLLSATSGVETNRPHQLARDDCANPILKERLNASKPTTLCVESSDLANAFAKTASDMAECLEQPKHQTPVVGVIVNRVRLARQIFERLRETTRNPECDALLLIGRSRGVERDRIAKRLEPFRTSNECRTSEGLCQEGEAPLDHDQTRGTQAKKGPLFVVATQCLEVGVDLDLDGLVTQAASFDALRQRFGRLNRAGRPIAAKGAIVVSKDALKKKADDPIYGDRIGKTWEVLKQIADDRTIDFGIRKLNRCLRDINVDVSELMAPRESAPVAMPAYFDLWSQTSPPPVADPDVGLFLHGVERRSADVALAWRGDITEEDLLGETVDLAPLLRQMPPRAGETIEVPLWSARAWLKRQPDNRAGLADVSDVPERVHDHKLDGTGKAIRPAYRWAGVDDPLTGPVTPDDLRPGDVLVLPATYGGCDGFGWNPEVEGYVTDVADEVARPFRRRRHAVRIARDVVTTGDQWDRLCDVLADDGVADGELIDRLLDILPSDSDEEGYDTMCFRSIREPVEALRHARGRVTRVRHPNENDGRTVLIAAQGLRQSGTTTGAGVEPTTEDDTLSHVANRAVTIDDHTNHVVQRVTRSVAALNLPACVANDLKLAAFLHDAGKADRRFQRYLSGGDLWNRRDGTAMAKSGRQVPTGAWERAGLPKGWRHEALSVLVARAHPRFSEAHDPKLVLWLIGTHHGLGRPFFDFSDPYEDGTEHEGLVACLSVAHLKATRGPGPQSMAFEFDGADWAALHQQLRQRYGNWGLAHLETILRLADHRASEFEQADE